MQSAQLDRLRARIAFAARRGNEAPWLLLNAATQLEAFDVSEARETHLEAFWAAILAGRLLGGEGIAAFAGAARKAPPMQGPDRPLDLLLDGLAIRFTEGYAAGLPVLRRALDACAGEREIRWLGMAARVAVELWDDELWHSLAARQTQLARDAGALSVLPLALNILVSSYVHAGEFSWAEALLEESDTITEATGAARLIYGALTLPPSARGRSADVGVDQQQPSRRSRARRGTSDHGNRVRVGRLVQRARPIRGRARARRAAPAPTKT